MGLIPRMHLGSVAYSQLPPATVKTTFQHAPTSITCPSLPTSMGESSRLIGRCICRIPEEFLQVWNGGSYSISNRDNNHDLCDFCITIWPAVLGAPSIEEFEDVLGAQSIEGWGEKLSFHDIAAVQNSAKQGCGICSRLWSRLSRDRRKVLIEALHNPNNPPKPTLQYLQCKCFWKQRRSNEDVLMAGYYITMRFHFDTNFRTVLPTEEASNSFSVDVHIGPDWERRARLPRESISRKGVVAKDDRLGSSWETITWWLKKCDSHAQCIAKSASPWLPTRVLDVGSSDNSSGSSLRLYEPSRRSEGRYMTLSHCWGKEPMFKLLAENKTGFCVGIHESQLPLTFREAISITRTLGVRYLWIDALCIIQDSVQDWMIEGSQMGNVYSNSYLNLAASASVNGNGGLYRDQDRAFFNDAVFSSVDRFGRYCGHDVLWCENDFQNSPLHARAWVLQELYLAPRTLHFAPTQLFWQCKDHFASERYADGHAMLYESPMKMVYSKRTTSTDPIHLCEEWSEIVEQYTSCDLTYSSDRAAAIAGVAQAFQGRFKNCGTAVPYLAGLWSYHLLHDLLWYIDVPQSERRCRPKEYRAPSWSWISVDGKIRLSSDRGVSERSRWESDGRIFGGCKFLGTAILPPDREHETAPIQDGHIHLRVRLNSIILSNCNHDSLSGFNGSEFEAKFEHTRREFEFKIFVDFDEGNGTCTTTEDTHLLCMPINRINTMDNLKVYVGLLLLSAQRSILDNQAFKRIGYFEVTLDPKRKRGNGITEDKEFEGNLGRPWKIVLV